MLNPNLSGAQFPGADSEPEDQGPKFPELAPEQSSADGGFGSVDQRQSQANVGNPSASQNANLSVQLDPARVASTPQPEPAGRGDSDSKPFLRSPAPPGPDAIDQAHKLANRGGA